MANVTSTQIIVDGPRNVVVKVEGILDTSDLASFTIVDPSTLSYIDTANQIRASKLRITRIVYNVEDTLEVRLTWDATTQQRIDQLTGRGHMEFKDFGGLTNNAGAGVTGKINLSTEGWATGKILSFTIVLELIKNHT